MRYRKLDLNLMVALDALLTESSVTRAAEALSVTQSAMSGSLARLREVFDDPLLVQEGRRMMLTPRAQALLAPTREALKRIDAVLAAEPSFDPQRSRRQFVVAASDYVIDAVLADVLQTLSREAPGVTFKLMPTADPRLVEEAEVDIAVLPASLALAQQPQARWFDDSYTVVAWQLNTRLTGRFTHEDYLRLGHVVFRPEHQGAPGLPWFEQWYRHEHGDRRRVEVESYAFSHLPRLVVGTERIATVPTRLAQRHAALLPLRLIPLPVTPPRLTEVLQWPRVHDADPAVTWLRERLQAHVQEPTNTPSPTFLETLP